MLVVPKSRIHFLQQVCKDRYVAMFMEKESLKRRMRLREITPHEYRALVHAASARSGSGGVRLPTRICARRLARRPCARTALADDQCNACLNRCLRVPLSHFWASIRVPCVRVLQFPGRVRRGARRGSGLNRGKRPAPERGRPRGQRCL